MFFSGYELVWLFFVYSFLGWVLETVAAACKQKRFVNRGLVNLPFCILYGGTEVFLSVFFRELQGVWLYVACVIWITVFKWIAGHLIEKMYHERWWDYSKRRWNIEGYVSFSDSALLGVLAVFMVKKGNAILLTAFDWIPQLGRVICVWTLMIALFLDVAATLVVLCEKEYKAKHCVRLERWFTRVTVSIGDKIYAWIEKRVEKAYPDAKKVEQVKQADTVFASGCSFYKIIWLFLIGAFLGDITETIFCRITMGTWMSRSSVVWGPFSIVWGLAIACVTALLYKYKDKPDRNLFFAGTFLGGAYEYICSVFTEIVFGKVFWDYSDIPFNLGGRINLLYCFFWGFAAVVWIKGIYPKISGCIEKIPVRAGKYLSWVLILFMCCNVAVSCLALTRSTQRKENIPAENSWQKIMDDRFDDERMERIYPNAIDTD